MVHLSAEPLAMQPTADISQATGIPVKYLPKVLRKLRRAGLVTMQQGVFGGVRLRHAPSKISLLDVINAIDPVKRDPQIHGGLAFARLDRTIDAIVADFIKRLAATKLADVVAAQKEIVLVARKLAAEGSIVFGGGDD